MPLMIWSDRYQQLSRRRRSRAALGLLLLVGFGLRLYRLGVESLWYDETVSAFLAGRPAADLIAHTARDIHPPGYYLLLRGWTLLAGDSEFALAFFSLGFGLLLIPLTYRFAHDLTRRRDIALGAAFFITISPYNIWYAQEVRMYTLGAFLGLLATWFLLRAYRATSLAFLSGYILCATVGLYTLYYFAFLLIILNLFILTRLVWPKIERRPLGWLIVANVLIIIAYLPWLPIAWRQATDPPVPPWRTPQSLTVILLESWTALSLGQSVQPAHIWPVLLVTLALFIFGLRLLADRSAPKSTFPAVMLLPLYTFGPLLLILLFSFITPLYHVRYLFTYAPPFYIILGAGLVGMSKRWSGSVGGAVASLLLIASLFSLYRFHTLPRYQADDFRGAVRLIEQQWRPGDVIVTNAGYTYTAFVYYTTWPDLERSRLVPYRPPTDDLYPRLLQTGSVAGSPQLGWGDPRADFYRMSAEETVTALDRMAADYHRLWLLRVYDTVTDPEGLIRAWLTENATPLLDQGFAGESYLRVQAFLLDKPPSLAGETVHFEDGLALAGWTLPPGPWQPGQTIPLQFGWFTTTRPTVDYKMSLKLWSETGDLAAQGNDTWPVGPLYRVTAWPLNQTNYQPDQLRLPADLPPGQYWLNVELYHPDSGQPLPRLDGGEPVVTLGPVQVE